PVAAPSAPTVISTTTASRSPPSPREVRSVDSFSGSIGKTSAAVYTEVVFVCAWPSIAEPFPTAASTSATATRIVTASPPAGTADRNRRRAFGPGPCPPCGGRADDGCRQQRDDLERDRVEGGGHRVASRSLTRAKHQTSRGVGPWRGITTQRRSTPSRVMPTF